MAANKRMDSDEEMLVPETDSSTVQQPFPGHPMTQQPYAGAASAPPSYAMTPHPYYPGSTLPMGQVGTPAVTQNTTTVIVNQPAPIVTGPRDWASSVCSCCDDMGSCLLGMFCPMILACQISIDMGESACVPCCVPGWLNVLRTKLRAENNIQGSVMDDCCMSCWCGHCVMCQMSRELKFIRQSFHPVQ
ncbi:placenta-specific gene 8 protein-like [Babylonia areolata]|uniref:placenta-specific gene 8 protein-like n=1 Tax=Babylonia areolata TaxID=304850 RepID=UPI003FD5AA96